MAGVTEGVSTEGFAYGVSLEGVEDALVVGVVACVGGTVGEDVVFIGFLGVGVRTHLEVEDVQVNLARQCCE